MAVVFVHAEPHIVTAGAIAAFGGEPVFLGRRRRATEADRKRAVSGRHHDGSAHECSRAGEPAAGLAIAVWRRQRVGDIEDELTDHRVLAGVGNAACGDAAGRHGQKQNRKDGSKCCQAHAHRFLQVQSMRRYHGVIGL